MVASGSYRRLVLPSLILLVVVALWEVSAGQDPLGMPSFSRTMEALIEVSTDGSLLRALAISNAALVAGFVLSLITSLVLGVALGLNRLLDQVAQPFLLIGLATPMIAVIPLIQAAFGLTLGARIAVVFLFAVVYMTVDTMVGVQSARQEWKEMARSFGASRAQMLRRVILPGAVPGIMAGVRLGIGRAVLGMIAAELTLFSAGIGSLIIHFQGRLQYAELFAVVVATLMEGVLLIELGEYLERRFTSWERGASIIG